MNNRLEGLGQTLDLLSQLLHVRLLVGHQLLEVERNDGVQDRQHLVCSENTKILTSSLEEETSIVNSYGVGTFLKTSSTILMNINHLGEPES